MPINHISNVCDLNSQGYWIICPKKRIPIIMSLQRISRQVNYFITHLIWVQGCWKQVCLVPNRHWSILQAPHNQFRVLSSCSKQDFRIKGDLLWGSVRSSWNCTQCGPASQDLKITLDIYLLYLLHLMLLNNLWGLMSFNLVIVIVNLISKGSGIHLYQRWFKSSKYLGIAFLICSTAQNWLTQQPPNSITNFIIFPYKLFRKSRPGSN